MSAPETADERELLARLRMVRTAKDAFLSDWYRAAPSQLSFSPESRNELESISQESRQEREALLAVMERWSRRLDVPQPVHVAAHDVARTARRDFLLSLIDMKDSSGESIERAALLAPPGLREELLELAAVDFRHATRLRQLLVDEVQEAWSTRSLRDAQ